MALDDELTVRERLWWPYDLGVAICVFVIVGIAFLGGLCELGENNPELYGHRCNSLGWRTLPLWGLPILLSGRIAAELLRRPWIAVVALPLSLVPSYLLWHGLDSASYR
jgi:hypothetical protein